MPKLLLDKDFLRVTLRHKLYPHFVALSEGTNLHILRSAEEILKELDIINKTCADFFGQRQCIAPFNGIVQIIGKGEILILAQLLAW